MFIKPADRKFYGQFYTLAVPIIIQNFLAASLNWVDNVMVGQLGDVSIAAVGLGNQVFFVLQLFLMGVSTGASLFVAQFWGKGDRGNIKKILGFALFIALSLSGVYFLLIHLFPARAIALFTDELPTIEAGAQYLQRVSWSYMITAFNFCLAAVLRSMQRLRQPVLANISGIAVNTFLNWILIFGHLGFSARGVTGAATATLIARMVEMAVLLLFVLPGRKNIGRDILQMFSFDRLLVKRFFSISFVMIIKDVTWGLGMTLYMAIYGRMGTEVVAGFNIMTAVRQLAFVLFGGYANACLIMVGKQLGASRFLRAKRDVKRVLKLTVLSGVIMSFIIVLARPLILSPYDISLQVRELVNHLLLVAGILLTANVLNMVVVMGVLRGGGDVGFSLGMDLTAVYLIGLPLGILAWKIFSMSPLWVFVLINLQEYYKLALLTYRVRSMKWLRNLVHDIPSK